MVKCTFLLFLVTFTQLAFAQEGVKKLDPNLSNYRYPFEVEYLELNIQKKSLSMAYMDVMAAVPNNRNIVLLHGKNFNGAYWETTVEALTNNGYRVIVPDQIGFGKSSKPQEFQYSFHQLAANTKALLESLQIEKAAILGHSMGGMLATRFALMYPDLTEKLILVNPIGLEDYKRLVPYQPVDWWYKNELEKDYRQIKQYQIDNYYDGKWKPEYEEWVNILAGWTLHEDYSLVAWNAALTYDMIFTQPVVHEFKDVKAPTLLIIGTRDRTALGKALVEESVRKTMGLYPELGKETNEKIQDSRLIELEGIGHLPHIESFEEFIAPLLDFLSK